MLDEATTLRIKEHEMRTIQDAITIIAEKDKGVQELTRVCETIITDGLSVRNTGKGAEIASGLTNLHEARADNAAVEFRGSNSYKAVKAHGNELVRSMCTLVGQRAMYAERKERGAKQSELKALLETQKYIVDTMVSRGWTGTQKPPLCERQIGQRPSGVSAERSLAGKDFRPTP